MISLSWRNRLTAGLCLLATPAVAQTPPPAPAHPPLQLDIDRLTAGAPATPVPVLTAPAVPSATLAPPAPLVPVGMPPLTPAIRDTLRTFLASAPKQGLTSEMPTGIDGLDDATLVARTLDLARALRAGRLAPSDFITDWGMQPQPYDPAPELADAIRRDGVKAWLADLQPPYEGYDGLRKGLARYRKIADAGGWTTLEDGPDLRPGASGAPVLALRRRLAIEDDVVATSGSTYDAGLVEAVRRAQRRYGLNPTGILNAGTRARLNVPVDERIHQITANLERWRWVPRTLPEHRVQVNIAAAVLTVFDGDQPVQSMRAVTGRPDDQTPMLASAIHSVVLNPPWNVPSSITAKELLPKEKAHPGFLKRNGFKVIKLADGGMRLQQDPEHSALGHYKFDFDNPYAVYLHDTPTRATFSRYDRLASHGCVRLEKPDALAARLLEDDPDWNLETLHEKVATGDTQRVRLPQPVAVYLLYWTAFMSPDGMEFRADPYGWDDLLAAKVAARGRAAQQMAQR